MNKKVLFLSGVHIICIRRKTGWAPLFKWHDYLCLVLYLPLFTLAPLRSRYSATVFLSPVALHSLAIDHSIDSSGFLHDIWERSATLAWHDCESLKTDPLKFFRRFSSRWWWWWLYAVIQNCIHMHMRIAGVPLSFAYQIHLYLRTLSRGPSLFYHRFFITVALSAPISRKQVTSTRAFVLDADNGCKCR